MLARKGIQRKNIPSTPIITHNNTIFYAYRSDSRACNENNDHRWAYRSDSRTCNEHNTIDRNTMGVLGQTMAFDNGCDTIAEIRGHIS